MNGINLSEPSSLTSCSLTTWKWSGGVAPYTLQLNTVLNTINVLLEFSNVLDTNFSATLNFPAGSIVTSIISDNTNENQPNASNAFNLTIGDSGNHDCYSIPSTSSTQSTTKGYGDLVNGEIPSCQPVSLQELGAAPYGLSLQTTNVPVKTYLNYSSISQRFIEISLPFPSGTTYQILFQNSTEPFIVAGPGPLNVSSGGPTNCLLQGNPASSSTSTTSNENPSSQHSRNIGAIVGGVVGGLAFIALCVSLLFIMKRRMKGKTREMRSAIVATSTRSRTGTVEPYSIPMNTGSSPASASISATGRSNLDRFRNPHKASPVLSSSSSPSPGSPGLESSSTEPQMVYHQDAGRIDVPPSYENARE